MSSTRITTDLDFDRNGRQLGALHLPLERAWAGHTHLALPMLQLQNGSGPTVLITGGTHGDEYEGPLAIGELIRTLRPEQIQGRLWLLPALNLPAVLAHSRDSPLDGRNLNREYPGDPDGSPTQQIAHYVDSVLWPRCQAASDLHTGGRELEIIPTSMSVQTEDPSQAARIRSAVEAFNAPLAIEIGANAQRATASRRATARGLTYVGCETGGGAPVSAQTLGVCLRGVTQLLVHLGVLDARDFPPASAPKTRHVRRWGFSGDLLAPERGVFVPTSSLWDEVQAGQSAGQLHWPEQPARAPQELRFPADGIVVGKAAHSGVEADAVLYWLGQPVD